MNPLSTLSASELVLFSSKYDVETCDLPAQSFIIDEHIVNHIKNTFVKVHGTTKEDHDIRGQTLDIDKFIQYKINKKFAPKENHDREFFNVTEDIQGLTVGILIDIGIHNTSENIERVRNTLASIYKGLSHVPNIKLLVYTYTGDLNKDNAKMNLIINEIDSLDKCNKIVMPKKRVIGQSRSRYYETRTRSVTGDIGTAPTFLAIDYITNKFRKIQDENKTALIVITEGRPSSLDTSGRLMDELTAQKLTYRSVTKAQANNIKTFALTLTNSTLADKELKEMFKGHVASGYGSNLEKELIQKIDEFIQEVNK